MLNILLTQLDIFMPLNQTSNNLFWNKYSLIYCLNTEVQIIWHFSILNHHTWILVTAKYKEPCKYTSSQIEKISDKCCVAPFKNNK